MSVGEFIILVCLSTELSKFVAVGNLYCRSFYLSRCSCAPQIQTDIFFVILKEFVRSLEIVD